jgi:putative CocE/NonD family hydrolase
MGALSGHPAMKAASPQAPVTEWFIGDDFHHNGAFMQMDAFGFYSSFGKPRPAPTTSFAPGFQFPVKDNYKFYLEAGTLKKLAELMGDSIRFWNDLYAHPNYDDWWEVRNTRTFTQHIPSSTATLVVGGLFDAEDCFGAWELYKSIEKKAANDNKLVMGPWSHGGWAKTSGDHLGNVRFGSATAMWYQENIEIPYFEYHLRGKGDLSKIAEANIFFTGTNEWRTFGQWPPSGKTKTNMYLNPNGRLAIIAPSTSSYDEYTSDPAKPVPYTEDVLFSRTSEYMTDDQRFASRRPDVLTYETNLLTEDLTLAGPVVANLFAAITTTDADFVVKLIDVFPDDFAYNNKTDGTGNGKSYPMGGYQMLVRGEIMRGRYRNSFRFPEAFVPGMVTEVACKLPDVAHVFKKGHRMMVQIQSSWFPLADRNPQQFVNIYEAGTDDFVRSTVRIYSGGRYPSHITLPVLR